jgi:hypothetical protein
MMCSDRVMMRGVEVGVTTDAEDAFNDRLSAWATDEAAYHTGFSQRPWTSIFFNGLQSSREPEIHGAMKLQCPEPTSTTISYVLLTTRRAPGNAPGNRRLLPFKALESRGR